jgi:hypothetical protein
MATVYSTAVLNPASATPAADLRAAIVAAVTGAGIGVTALDDGYNDSTYVRSVLKWPIATSGLAYDFYIILWHAAAGTGDLYAQISESYTAGSTHQMTRIGLGRGAYTLTADHSYNGSTGISLAASSATLNGVRWRTAGQTNYSLFIYTTGITIATLATANNAHYLGAFTSLVNTPATNDPVAIGYFNLNQISATNYDNTVGGMSNATRAAQVGAGSISYALWLTPANGLSVNTDVTNAAQYDLNQGNAPLTEPLMITVTLGSSPSLISSIANNSVWGYLRGKLPNHVIAKGGSYQDTINCVVGGTTLTYQHTGVTLNGGGSIWALKS